MRVLFVNSMRAFGGGEQWLLEVARGLSSRGHDVALAARPGSALCVRAALENLPCRRVAMRGDLDLASMIGLAGWMKEFRPDLVSVNIKRAVRVGCASARLAGVRAVVERRGLLLPLDPNRIDRLVYERCVTHVIANCEAIRDSVVRSGLVPEERISVIPNGIDPSRVAAGGGREVRAELGIGGDDRVVAVVGRLVSDKGHRTAIDAFTAVASEHPDVRLLIVGAGKLRGDLEERARGAAPSGAIIFTGERADIGAILDASDVLLVASRREGMPHVILEAMVAGVPIVATAVAGIPEMIADGRDGILVPPGSPGALAATLSRVLFDSAEAARLSEAAGRRVREEFGLERMIDRVEECFAGAVARERRGGTRG